MLESFIAAFDTTSWGEFAAVAAAMLLAGFVRGFVGFGASMIIVLVISQVWSPMMAVPIATLSGVPSMLQLLPTALRQSERALLAPFGIATILATPIGTWVLVSTDPTLMKIAIAVLVIAMVAMLYKDWQPSRPVGPVGLAGVGIFSGLIQGAGGVGGPPAVVVALSRGGTPHRMRANVIAVVAAISIGGLPPLIWYGLVTPQVLLISVVMFPFYSGATWLGSKYFSNRGHGHFRTAALAALAVVGVATLIISARDYLGG